MGKIGGIFAGLIAIAFAYGGLRTLYHGLSQGETVSYFLAPAVVLGVAYWLGTIAFRDLSK